MRQKFNKKDDGSAPVEENKELEEAEEEIERLKE